MQIRGREKILAIVVLSLCSGYCYCSIGTGAILKPAKDLRNQKVQLQVSWEDSRKNRTNTR